MEISGRQAMSPIDALFDPTATTHEAASYPRPGAVRAEVVSVDLGEVIINVGERPTPVATSSETLAGRIGIAVALRPTSSAHVIGEPIGLGVAYAFGDAADVAANWRVDRVFEPAGGRERIAELAAGWHKAVARAKHWAD